MNDKTTPTFQSFGLREEILKAIIKAGYETPSPIQAKAIKPIMQGSDVFACAQTGTGKTAAFCLPIIDALMRENIFPTAKTFTTLILTPTRELAEQIYDNVKLYTKFTHLASYKVYGGVSQRPQAKNLEAGLDILVATPGRLLDLFRQNKAKFDGVKFLVLDEADRMLDMGFLPDIKKICAMLPKDRQSLLFSATLDEEVAKLAADIVRNPIKISVSPESPTVERITQKLYFCPKANKYELLLDLLANKYKDERALIFCRTKHGADRLAKKLVKDGILADAIHAGRTQAARKASLEKFKENRLRVLSATDIAARGLDIKEMPLVVNFELPEEAETYIHRIGRTARANADGEAISFCSEEEAHLLKYIQKLIRRDIEIESNHPYHFTPDSYQSVEPKRGGMRASKPSSNQRGKFRRTDQKKFFDKEFGEPRKASNKSAKNFGGRFSNDKKFSDDKKSRYQKDEFSGESKKSEFSRGNFSDKKRGIKFGEKSKTSYDPKKVKREQKKIAGAKSKVRTSLSKAANFFGAAKKKFFGKK